MKIYQFDNVYTGTAHKKYLKYAKKELKNIDEKFKIIDRFPDGVFTFKTSLKREDFHKKLQDSPPVFLRHIQPVDILYYVPMDADIAELAGKCAEHMETTVIQGKKTAVQARRIPGNFDFTAYSIKKSIDPVLISKFNCIPEVKNPEAIISFFFTDYTEIDCGTAKYIKSDIYPDESVNPWKGVCLMGYSTPEENLNHWSGGIARFAKEDEQVSRAEFKLLEALDLFPVPIKENGNALDLGSSPGGWARILHQKGYNVTAVDRAPIDPSVTGLGGVRAVRQDAIHYRGEDKSFDLITDDINRDPATSAKTLLKLTSALKDDGHFIMTIKLSGKNPGKIIDKTVEVIKNGYEIGGIRQLFYNRDEVTVWGRKK